MAVDKIYQKVYVKRGDSKVPIEFDLSSYNMEFAKKDDGDLAIFGCGCSMFEAEGSLIKGIYKNKVTSNVTKSYILFFDDGKPLYKKNHKGVEAKNLDKLHVELKFDLIIKP